MNSRSIFQALPRKVIVLASVFFSLVFAFSIFNSLYISNEPNEAVYVGFKMGSVFFEGSDINYSYSSKPENIENQEKSQTEKVVFSRNNTWVDLNFGFVFFRVESSETVREVTRKD